MERVKDRSPEETRARFWSWVDKTDGGCWLWTGVLRTGYGRFKLRGHIHTAHRWAYEDLVGPIPAGLCLHHAVCGNRACVNPAHLELVTVGENTAYSNGARARKED